MPPRRSWREESSKVRKKEAPAGLEPAMANLQSAALANLATAPFV